MEKERGKKVRWSNCEHELFLRGIDKYGKGNWKIISSCMIPTKTPSQIASHAQKFFNRQRIPADQRRRRTIHDICTTAPHLAPQKQQVEVGAGIHLSDDTGDSSITHMHSDMFSDQQIASSAYNDQAMGLVETSCFVQHGGLKMVIDNDLSIDDYALETTSLGFPTVTEEVTDQLPTRRSASDKDEAEIANREHSPTNICSLIIEAFTDSMEVDGSTTQPIPSSETHTSKENDGNDLMFMSWADTNGFMLSDKELSTCDYPSETTIMGKAAATDQVPTNLYSVDKIEAGFENWQQFLAMAENESRLTGEMDTCSSDGWMMWNKNEQSFTDFSFEDFYPPIEECLPHNGEGRNDTEEVEKENSG